jgi:predicted N-acetyltransferase YhbS
VAAGFYTLAATGLPMTALSAEEARHLPRDKLLPAFRIGRLAVDARFQGLRLGSALIMDAAARASARRSSA